MLNLQIIKRAIEQNADQYHGSSQDSVRNHADLLRGWLR